MRGPQEIADEHQSIAEERLQGFLESEFPASACERILCSGEAAAEISHVARSGGFDLIVMPTHAGRFRRMLLGSTTAKVMDDSGCMVMTTDCERKFPRPLQHRVWVCAIGLSEDSERVLRLASRAAAEVGAQLSVIHAGVHSSSEEAASDAWRRLHELLETVGCAARVRIVSGPVKEALLDAAVEAAADALIVGRRLRTGGFGRLRDLTYSLIRDSPFPVLSV